MTTANKISIFRVLLVPVFVAEVLYYVESRVELHRVLAIVCFAIASLSDAVDGYIARRCHQSSPLGAILDPLADKLLLVSGIILLSFDHEPSLPRLPLWLAVSILSRDLLLLIGWFLVHHACGKVRVRPALIGKAATVLQMACILWALLRWPAVWLFYLSLAAAFCTAASAILYVVDGVRQFAARPASAASAKQP